jgi:outer membrane murein-binding lipoprotein Lpp
VWDARAVGCAVEAVTILAREGVDTSKVEEFSAEVFPAASSQEKAEFDRGAVQQQLHEARRWNEMRAEPCDGVMSDEVTKCNSEGLRWRVYDSEIRAFVCKHCCTIRMASAAEVKMLG